MYFRREDLKEKRRYIDLNFKTLLRVNSVFLIFINYFLLLQENPECFRQDNRDNLLLGKDQGAGIGRRRKYGNADQ